MNNTLLLQKFNLLATPPGGVAKLRELILTLAVQGKLVPQDPADEPASELLKRIRAEKDRLIAAGKIKRDKSLAPMTEDDQPFGLPHGWEWVRLADLMPDFQNGASSRGDVGGKPITVLRLADIKDKRISLADTRQVPIAPADIAKYQLAEGDILITRVNGSADIVGQFNLCDRPVEAIYCDHFIRMRIDRRCVEPSFCALLGESSLVRSAIKNLFITTAGQKTVNQGHIGSLQFPLPPLPEQARIVARVEELMRVCDALEAKGRQQAAHHTQLVSTLLGSLTANAAPDEQADDLPSRWQRVAQHFDTLLDRPEAIDTLEQTILQLAVRGQLVPQDPTDEPASELLKRIRTEKDRLMAEGKIKRDKPLAPIGEDEQPFGLPQGWEWVRVGSVVEMLNGYAFKSETFKPTGVRLLRNLNVSHGYVDWAQTVCVSPIAAKEFDAFQLFVGDVVLSLDRPIISTGLKFAVLGETDLPCLLLQRVAKLNPSKAALSSDFLVLWLQSDMFVGTIDPGRSNGVPHISTKQVSDLLFPLPPLREQARIVARVAHLRRLCADLRQRLTQSQTTQAALAEGLVSVASAVDTANDLPAPKSLA
jgi:type I restriction enzyme S subunit